MKAMKKLVLVGLVMMAGVMVLVGCDTNAGDNPSNTAETTQQPSGDGSGKTEPQKYIVEFNTDGGSAVDSQSVESGKMATKPEDPSLEGSWFLGWYRDKELTKEFDFTSPIINNTEVYAKWSYKFHAIPQILTEYTSPNNTNDALTYVAFGDWPQTIKASGITVNESKSKQMGMFTAYLGSDGNYYVKEKENAYGSGTEYEYSDGSQAGQGRTSEKWFKVEPIVWRVLTWNYNSTEKALLLAEKILTGGREWDDDKNNYKESNIRKWLNGNSGSGEESDCSGDAGFLQTAFSKSAQNLIAKTIVYNSKETANPDGNATLWNEGKNEYACGNTKDKIFLLSGQEATTEEYVFANFNVSGKRNTRIRFLTDYAKATGAWQSEKTGYGYGYGGWWWLRSPNWLQENNTFAVDYEGYPFILNPVNYRNGGVVPALSISLQ